MNKQRLFIVVAALTVPGSLAVVQACDGAVPTASALAEDGPTSNHSDGGAELDSDGADGKYAPDSADATSACPGLKGSPMPVTTCTRTFGDGLKRLLVGGGVAADSDGNIVFAGDFEDAVDFGGGALVSAGERDAFVVKLDAQCNHLWSKSFGGPSVQGAVKVRIDGSGNIYVAIGARGGSVDVGTGPLTMSSDAQPDFVVAKLDPCGTPAWARHFGGSGAQILRDMAVNSSGDVALVGGFLGELDFGNGKLASDSTSEGIFIARLDTNGAPVWSRGHFSSGSGANRQSFARSVIVDDTGAFRVTGTGRNNLDFGSGALSFPADSFGAWDARFSSGGALASVNTIDSAYLVQARSISGEYYQAVGLSAPADLGSGPMLVPDGGGTAFYPSALGKFNIDDRTPSWIRGFGTSATNPDTILSIESIAATSSAVAISAWCGVSGADYGSASPCSLGQPLLLQYGLDGVFQSATPHAQGQLAATPSGQFVIAASASTTAGAPEKIIITKLAP